MTNERFGVPLLVVGLVLLTYGALWQLGVAPESRMSLPAPVVAKPPQRHLVPEPPLPAPTPQPLLTLGVSIAPRLSVMAPADAVDRAAAPARPAPGYAVRLTVPKINLDTQVKQGSIVPDTDGSPTWQTLPFVAVHYGELTSLVGARGNAVIAGHVVTLYEGNVFRLLYRLEPGDAVSVFDDREQEHDYRVDALKLVPPTDTSIMAQTPDEVLTLITCGGTFDPIKREFSARLVVTARPV